MPKRIAFRARRIDVRRLCCSDGISMQRLRNSPLIATPGAKCYRLPSITWETS
jgi:hypothetical protein